MSEVRFAVGDADAGLRDDQRGHGLGAGLLAAAEADIHLVAQLR